MSTSWSKRSLHSRHGTRVFLDVAQGRLRHGDEATCPSNVFVAGTGDACALIHAAVDNKTYELRLTAGSLSSHVEQTECGEPFPLRWSLVPSDEGAVALRYGGYYLCADPEGEVTLSRTQAHAWEQFRIRRSDAGPVIEARQPTELMLLPHGIFLRDEGRDLAIGVRWEAVAGDGFVHAASMPDGSWPIEACQLLPGGDFELLWLHPFSARVSVWRLDGEGRRVDGGELSYEDARDFFFQRLDRGPVYVIRLFLLLAAAGAVQEKSDLPARIAPLLASVAEEEAIYAVCAHPDYFWPAVVAAAMTAARALLHSARLCCPPDPAHGTWHVRLDAFAALITAGAPPGLKALEQEIGLARELQAIHQTAAAQGQAAYLPRGEHLVVRQVSTTEMTELSRPIDNPKLVFRMEFCPSGATPALVQYAGAPGGVSGRLLESIGIMHMILKEQIGRAAFIEFARSRGIDPDARRAVIFQAWDSPHETARSSLAFGRSVGNERVTLVPDLYYWESRGYRAVMAAVREADLPWSERRPVVVWRGSTTGAEIRPDNLEMLPRYRLCRIAQALGAQADVGISSVVQAAAGTEHVIAARLRSEGLLRQFIPHSGMGHYRFVVEIDGNSNSWGFIAKLMLGSCLLKVASRHEQWFYPALEAWKHYVPVAADLSDFAERVTWCIAHPEEAERIGRAGQAFALGMDYAEESRKAAFETLRTSEPV